MKKETFQSIFPEYCKFYEKISLNCSNTVCFWNQEILMTNFEIDFLASIHKGRVKKDKKQLNFPLSSNFNFFAPNGLRK